MDIGKLETTPVDLSNLNNGVKNDVIKKTEHNELVKKFIATQTTDTSNLVVKNDYNKKLLKLKRKLLILIIVIRILLHMNLRK